MFQIKRKHLAYSFAVLIGLVAGQLFANTVTLTNSTPFTLSIRFWELGYQEDLYTMEPSSVTKGPQTFDVGAKCPWKMFVNALQSTVDSPQGRITLGNTQVIYEFGGVACSNHGANIAIRPTSTQIPSAPTTSAYGTVVIAPPAQVIYELYVQ